MKTYRYVGIGHNTGPTSDILSKEHAIEPGDVITLIARVDRYSFFLLPSGAIRWLSYQFEKNEEFVEISL
jgi:hypothetical protein